MTTRKLPQVNARVKLIEAITTPLGFFALALLLIAKVLVATPLVFSDLPSKDKLTVTYIGVALFLIVIAIVAVLAWYKPQHLTFDKDAHIDEGNRPG